MRYYVYIYRDPETGAPFYVGKGTGHRAHEHLRIARGTTRTHFHRKLRRLLNAGKAPVIEKIATGLDEADALRLEVETIANIGLANLTNTTPGGECPPSNKGMKFPNRKPPSTKGKPGKPWSEEDKARHCARMRAFMADEAVRKRVADAKRGRPGPKMSDVARAKVGAAHRGKPSEAKSKSKRGERNPMFGHRWFNDGERRSLFHPGSEPAGWRPGKRLNEAPPEKIPAPQPVVKEAA